MPAKANAEWQKWGDTDPLFGVSNWAGKSIAEGDAWTDEDFYAMGESDWADFLRHWQQYGVSAGECVEIGSGAGRLTRHMATFFSHVHGVDVSAGMIKKAEQAVEGLPVTLYLSDGLTLPLNAESVDAAFSTHVFQHLDSAEDALANWREIARVLRPDGTLMVHLPVHMWPGGLARLQGVYAARRRVGDWRAAVKRRRMASGGAPIMRGQSYDWTDLETTLASCGFLDIELRLFRVAINDGLHPFVLARKPGSAS